MENDGRMNSVTYHFPKLNSKKVQTKGIIQYYMIGKENEPNVSYKKGSSHIPFVSEKMYICAKQETSAILIVENRSVTNTDKKLFLCVPLITKEQPLGFAKKQSRNILDDIIQDIQTNFSEPNNDIHLDSVLPENTTCNIIETRFAIVVYLKTPIPVYSYFTGLDSSSIPGFIREYRIENIINEFGQGSFGTQQLTHNGESHPDEFGQRAKLSTTNFEDDQMSSVKFGPNLTPEVALLPEEFDVLWTIKSILFSFCFLFCPCFLLLCPCFFLFYHYVVSINKKFCLIWFLRPIHVIVYLQNLPKNKKKMNR